jgi:hypothetical protein
MFSRRISTIVLCLSSLFISQLCPAQPRDTASEPPQQSINTQSLDGVWLGTLYAGEQTLNLRLTVKADDSGQKVYTLYSLDQGAKLIPCTNVKQSGKSLSFDVPLVQGHWSGQVSDDGKTLSGVWKQTTPHPLTFTRQTGTTSK